MLQKKNYAIFNQIPYPIGIFSFDGEPIDCNNAMLTLTGAKDKSAFMKLTCPQRLVDQGKAKLMLEKQIEIENKAITRNLLRKLDKDQTITVSTCKIQVFSMEDQTFIVQNAGGEESNLFLIDRFNFILNEIKNLNPYLNKEGKNLLYNIIKSTNSIKQFAPDSPFIIEKEKELNLHKYKLTNTELYVCILVGLKFSNFEIAYLSGYTPNYLRVTIHRICKKLNLVTRENLATFLQPCIEGKELVEFPAFANH